MSSNDQLEKALRARGYSLTKPRRAVFKVLSLNEPQTMREVCLQLGGQVDRASVYRTVKLFSDLGVAKRLQIGWKYKLELSDAFSQHHHHFVCQKCGQLINLPESDQLETQIRRLANQAGLKLTDHQLEIQGLCPQCQA